MLKNKQENINFLCQYSPVENNLFYYKTKNRF